MRKSIILFALLYLCGAGLSAQDGDTPAYLSPKDTIFLEINHRGQKTFKHILKKGQTLYSLSKFYGLPLSKVYEYNPGIKGKVLSLNAKITLPVPNRAILRSLKAGQDPRHYAPVYYIVRKGDTMFGIAKRHFRMPVDSLKARNRLETHDLKVGQPIRVGWMGVDGIPRDWQYPNGTPGDVVAENERNKADFLSQSRWRKTGTNQGKAVWNASSGGLSSSGLFCLHKTAPRNSIIRLENPLTGNVVYAKVIGRIPTNYERWVVFVVSKDVAFALRAPDKQFFIKAEYFIK